MKVHFEKATQNRNNAHTIVELYAIRDGIKIIANCYLKSCTEASKLIDLITLEYLCCIQSLFQLRCIYSCAIQIFFDMCE